MIKLTFSNPLLSCYCSQGSPKIDLKKDGYLFADNRVINKKIKKKTNGLQKDLSSLKNSVKQ